MTTQNKTNNVIEGLRWLFNLSGLPGFDFNRSIVGNAIDEIERLRDERDEARRMYCHMAGQVMYRSYNKSTAEHIANNRSWDCYQKEKTK